MESSERDPIEFFVDEMLPVQRMTTLIRGRGHLLRQVDLSEKDPAILRTAEAVGAVVITSDRYFYKQLHLRPPLWRSDFRRAGVVLIPGEWNTAEPLIAEWLPVIEVAYRVLQDREDKRLVVSFEPRLFRLVIDSDPDPTTVRRLRLAGITET